MHTPLPWEVSPDGAGIYVQGSDQHICEMAQGIRAVANAAFIVHACNAHDALLEACRFVAKHLRIAADTRNNFGPAECRSAVKVLDEAIAKAEGRTP